MWTGWVTGDQNLLRERSFYTASDTTRLAFVHHVLQMGGVEDDVQAH